MQSVASHRVPAGRRVALLSTFPPRKCGIATFAAALQAELTRAGDSVTVVAIDDGREATERRGARYELANGIATSVRETARVLSQGDVALVQHEFGIYGGVDGDEVLSVLRSLTVPAVLTLHTVPALPSAHQRTVLEAACDVAARVVVMTGSSRDRLVSVYDIDAAKVVVIPHGAAGPSGSAASSGDRQLSGRLHLLTWGLLGPGKGIEHVITALSLLTDLRPRIKYTVAGATHPNVFARDGDRYRQSLIRSAWASGVAASVHFDDTYRDLADLLPLVASASVVVLPYDSRDQATSGVLVDAIAAGRPVIATAFPHAVEALSTGAGIIVPHEDPIALAAAIRAVVADPELIAVMSAQARAISPTLSWSVVGGQYRDVCEALASTVDARMAM